MGKKSGTCKVCQHPDQVHTHCYPSESRWKRWAGFLCIGAGVIIIILCVPLWAWGGILGAALILVGLLLTKG